MFTKSALALAALLIVAATATVSAYEAPENKIGDRYPFLEQTYNPAAARSVGPRHMKYAQAAILNQDIEDPEAKIADRFPFLEQSYNPAVAHSVGPKRTASSQVAIINQDVEDPENKIGDRYPMLEQTVQIAAGKSYAAARMTRSVKSVSTSQKALVTRATARTAY